MSVAILDFVWGGDSEQKITLDHEIPEVQPVQITGDVQETIEQRVKKDFAKEIENVVDASKKLSSETKALIDKMAQQEINQINYLMGIDVQRDKQNEALRLLRLMQNEKSFDERKESFEKSALKEVQKISRRSYREARKVKKSEAVVASLKKAIEQQKKVKVIIDKIHEDQTPIKSVLNTPLYGLIIGAITITETLLVTNAMYNFDSGDNSSKLLVGGVTLVLTIGQAICGHFGGIQSIKLGRNSLAFKTTFAFGTLFSLFITVLRNQSGAAWMMSIISMLIFWLEIYLSRLRYSNHDPDKKINRLQRRLVRWENRIQKSYQKIKIDEVVTELANDFNREITSKINKVEANINAIDRIKEQIKSAVRIEVLKIENR